MPEYRRARAKGGTFFFTVVTHLRRPILTTQSVRQSLRQGILQARLTLPFKIDAWVLLPDHLHTIWTMPADDDNYGSRWAIIKRQVSKSCSNQFNHLKSDSKQKRGESSIWQRRFWEHQIRDELDLERHMNYLHWNPVKHGYVQKVVDWPFSSFHRLAAQGIYSVDWGGEEMEQADSGNFGE